MTRTDTMVCAKCGDPVKGSGRRCCLCNKGGNSKMYPWGKTRVICGRCKDKQELLIQKREDENIRVKVLMNGIDVDKKDLEKWRKTFIAQNVKPL